MPDLNGLLALKTFAEGAWDAFAGFEDWRQQGDRMVSPSGKRKLTLEAFQRLRGRPKKEPAPKGPKRPAGPKGGPKPGEPERILTAKARIAREAHEAAVRQKLPAAEVEALKRRADAAEAELKAGPKPAPTVPVTSLPAVPKGEVRAPAPKPKGAPPAKPAGKVVAPEFDPKKKTADPGAVVRRQRTEVQGKPIVGKNAANRAGAARGKLAAAQATKPVPVVPPRADGSPDLPALKNSVDAGVVPGGRALNWGYETTAARAALKAAEQQLDDFARKFPRKVAPLAREVTGQAPESTEDAVKKLKTWVGETLDLLDPSHRGRGGVARHSERRTVFAELRGRMEGVRALCVALAG